MKVNFLAETALVIKNASRTPEMIVFIGSRDAQYSCNWKEFSAMANFNYENTAVGQVVATDLTIVFNDGSSLYRVDDAGVERWTTEILPPRIGQKRITKLRDGVTVTRTVDEMNKVAK